jgi:hypothetical protein
MQGREKLNMDKYKEIMDDWNYDAYSTSVFTLRKF